MAVDVSNLVNILATQPVAHMESLGQKIESAQMYKAKQEQQDIENYRNAVKDNLERQVKMGQLRKEQLEATKNQMEITAGVAGSILQSKDPLVRQQIFEQAVPTLKSAGYTDQQIEAARTKLPDDGTWKGYVAQGAGVKEIYNTYFGTETVKPPTTRTYRKEGEWVTEEYSPATKAWTEVGRSPIKEEGPQTVFYGEKPSLKYAESAMKQMEKATEKANLARQSNASMQYGQQLLQGMNTGSLSDVNLALGKMASSLGVEFKEVGKMDAAKGAFADMVKNSLSAFPGAISEGERAYAISVSPQLTSTPEGREKLVNFLNEINDRAIEYQRMMDAYVASNPNMTLYKEGAPSFVQEWDKYMKENPLSILSDKTGKAPKITPEQWGSAKQAMRVGETEYRVIGGKWVDATGEEYKSGR